ncbi:hypothetical protein NEOC65_001050 [Neochlamydia sp. AcF65]|nr:hypothetical protein [Neochlamydia sp. AcF65]MBS4169823.1 hypothetical protein [Neochlamydia sp. AcF95]
MIKCDTYKVKELLTSSNWIESKEIKNFLSFVSLPLCCKKMRQIV